MKSADFKITKARSDLIRIQPFFGNLALRLKPTPTINLPVMGTDGRTLYYNPGVVQDMAQPKVLGVVAHEVLHCALQHVFRRRHRDPAKWNAACDYVVNAILLKEGFSLPSSRLFKPEFEGMSAEEVYDKLPKPPPPRGRSGDGDPADDWNFGSSLDPTLPRNGEEPTTLAEAEATAKDWEIATKQAAHVAKQTGTLPGYLESLIEELLQPQIPWREQLWRFFNKRQPDRITWNRPNRRLVGQGVYIPSRRTVPTGDIVVAVDTSGSISEQELQIFASEMNEIHKALQPRKLYIADIDTKIHGDVKEYGPHDKLEFIYHGRGGTSFEPVFQWVKDNDIQPDALVYLTDGYASWPEEVFDYPVLWCITNHEQVPPWGEHLILDL